MCGQVSTDGVLMLVWKIPRVTAKLWWLCMKDSHTIAGHLLT